MILYVIRHGETEMGKQRIIATESEPLNETGVKQAVKAGRYISTLNVDVIYCSPINRAIRTLDLFDLDKRIPVIIDDRIRERNMGEYEEVPFDRLNWDVFWNYNSDIMYPGMESMKDTYERVSNFLDELSVTHKNDKVLLVTHGGICRVIYWYFNGIPESGNSSNVNDNCRVYSYEK